MSSSLRPTSISDIRSSVLVNTITTAVITASLLLPNVAHAQHSGNFGQSANPANNGAYFTSGDYTLTSDVSTEDVFIGKTDTGSPTTNFQTYTPALPVTLTIDTGAIVIANESVPKYPDGNFYFGLDMFGGNALNVKGGSIREINGYNSSTTSISGGTVQLVQGHDNNTISITGGIVANVDGSNATTINISGGTPVFMSVLDNCTMNVYGGTITDGSTGGFKSNFFIYGTTSEINFYGSGFSSAYTGYDGFYGYDHFVINGTLQDGKVLNNVPLYIMNSSGTGDDLLRQVAFNPVVIPEAGTLSLLIAPAFGIICICRRKRSV